MQNIIFVGGIHGVGKSYFCNQIKQRYNTEHFSCSSLISEYKKQTYHLKQVKNIDSNQNILLDALSKISLNKPFLLDGHFCLITPEQYISKIPIDTFLKISPKSIIVLKDDPDKIYTRLLNRDNHKYDIKLLQEMQNIELNYSKYVSQQLSVPYYILDVSNPDESLNTFLDSLFNNCMVNIKEEDFLL